jgi:hypothetical protein
MPAWKRPHLMSALPPQADVVIADHHFRFVPKADIPLICSLGTAPLPPRLSRVSYF